MNYGRDFGVFYGLAKGQRGFLYQCGHHVLLDLNSQCPICYFDKRFFKDSCRIKGILTSEPPCSPENGFQFAECGHIWNPQTTNCPMCLFDSKFAHYAEVSHRAIKQNEDMGLPPLFGSIKQIPWAEVIRSQFFNCGFDTAHGLLERYNSIFTENRASFWINEIQNEFNVPKVHVAQKPSDIDFSWEEELSDEELWEDDDPQEPDDSEKVIPIRYPIGIYGIANRTN